jgi:glyoxylase-like metal-dependent hydrolase (beta-lactamase superfamily II)
MAELCTADSGRHRSCFERKDFMTVLSLPDINQFKLGPLKFTVIKDGTSIIEKPWETFGVNQKPETVQALLAANFLPTDRFVNSYSPVIVDTGSDVILFDTGFGAAMREKGSGRLAAGMKAAGYAPEQVTRVVLTHLHGDHVGGLMEDGKPSFVNATYIAGRIEYDFWTDAARAGTPAEGNQKSVLANVVPLAEKITFVNDGDNVFSGVTAMLAPGHTPGHMVFHIESDGQQVVLTADTANHYVLSLQQPDWEVRFDMDRAQAAQTRRRIFDMIAKDRIPFIGYHMPFPAVGFAEKIDTGFRFVPKSYQYDF